MPRTGMSAFERKVMITQTAAFIAADQWDISLNRPAAAGAPSNQDGRGGRLRTPETVVPAQAVRIVSARTRSSALTYTLPSGEVISSKDMLMLGTPDLDVQRKDWFEWQGRALQVSYVEPDRTYQTICQLDEMGDDERSTYG